MSSKEIKAALKEAREAVKNRKFSEAIELCNKVLKEQNDNYMALLLLGASYQDSDKKEAATYLKRALNCSTEPLVALQGLVSCADAAELPDICEKLLALTPDKYAELHAKLAGVAAHGIVSPVLRILEKEITCEDSVPRQQSAYEWLGKLVSQNVDLDETEAPLVAKVLERELLNDGDLYQRDKFRRYLRLLHLERRYDRLASIAAAMHERFPSDIFPLEWICKLYAESIVPAEKLPALLTHDLATYAERAVTVAPNSAVALLAKGKLHFAAGELAAAESALKRANEVQPLWTPCMELLAEIYFRQKAYVLAEHLYRNMNAKHLNYAIALLESEDEEKLREADQCFAAVRDATDQSSRLLFFWCKTKLLLGDAIGAEKIYEQLTNAANAGVGQDQLDYLLALREKLTGNVEQQLVLLSAHEASSLCLLELSMALYAMEGKREESFYAALKATKLDPSNARCYWWLGKLYLERADPLRARKCLEKSVHLNPAARNAVILLSGLYRRYGEWDANAALLRNTFALCSGAAWAQLQLGLHHLGRQGYDEAITAFRTVLRFEVDNETAWEGLADAYLGRGSYSSAMKVFEKITERNPSNPYTVLQLANIKNAVKLYAEGLTLFERLLAQHENYFPAIKGIADSHHGLCLQRLSQRLLGTSRDHAQLCVDHLSRAIKMKPSFVCLWHQLGKVLDTAALFPSTHAYLRVEGALAGREQRSDTQLHGGQLAELAGRCYGRIIKNNPENSILWYELSRNYFNRAKMVPTVAATDENDRNAERIKLLTKARQMAMQAITLDASRWQNWNLLGVICATNEINNLALAQHCFVEAVTVDRKTAAAAWSNLGVLYLAHDELALANKAFSRAQQCDTAFLNAWIGQAMIAETVGQADEAMDLFRHCTQLGYHRESSLGYTHWVCAIVNEDNYQRNERYRFAVDEMAALPVSHDAISWHCADLSERASMPALRFLGNISSRLGLWHTAADAYRRALLVDGSTELERDKVRCDLGYCLLKQQRYDEAVQCYETMRGEPFYRASVGRAQSYFRAAQYAQSYAEYEQVLAYLAHTDLEKAYVLIAMSAMVYAFQGESDAKTILFQCITLPEPPIQALFSACALGLLHKDNELTELVIQELRKHEDDPIHGHHVVFLVAEFYWQNNQQSKCRAYLLSQLHRYPNRPKLWQILAMALVKRFRVPTGNLRLACSVAQGAVALDQADRRHRTRSDDAARWMAVASEAVRPLDARRCRVLAQKALHLDPTSREAWGAFQRIPNEGRA